MLQFCLAESNLHPQIFQIAGETPLRSEPRLLAPSFRSQLYERNLFTSKPHQKLNRFFTLLGKIVNSSINKTLSYMSPDWIT